MDNEPVSGRVPIVELPESWTQARLALRLTAKGTESDPGPRVVHADQLGTLALLIRAADTATVPIPDVESLHHAATAGPWALHTLDTIATAPACAMPPESCRSTTPGAPETSRNPARLAIRDPQGRFRLHLALAVRRALRQP